MRLRSHTLENSQETNRLIVMNLAVRGSRVNFLRNTDLIINDKIATYKQFIDKMVYEEARMSIDVAIYWYVNNEASMKEVVIRTGLRENYIRKEFEKRGVTIYD